MIFPKNREIGSLVVRPGEKLKNLETHGRIMRVRRSASPRGHVISSISLYIDFIKNELEMPSDQLKKKIESE